MDNFVQLRQKHERFIYHSFSLEKGTITFHFSIDATYHFYPTWEFDPALLDSFKGDYSLLSYAIFNLGMSELVSYWKCACPKTVEILCGALNEEQVLWWKKLYFNGLSEFFYRNGISTSLESFMDILPKNTTPPLFKETTCFSGCLVPVGGGKDSVVTLELLKKANVNPTCYMINGRKAAFGCIDVAGIPNQNILNVRRTIHPQLLELNRQGYLNGHTPFSSVVAFSSWIFAYLLNLKYIVLSNESSANESNVAGTQINHQYSKSTEFESDFRNYASKYLSPIPEYFSLLRPWSEYRITKEFVNYPKYFSVFQSCNVGTKNDIWCGSCAKCLYVCIMLAACVSDDTLISIFGKNPLDDSNLEKIFLEMVLENEDKPFECIGTRAETIYAIQNAIQNRSKDTLPYLLRVYSSLDLPAVTLKEVEAWNSHHFVPNEFIPLLEDSQE